MRTESNGRMGLTVRLDGSVFVDQYVISEAIATLGIIDSKFKGGLKIENPVPGFQCTIDHSTILGGLDLKTAEAEGVIIWESTVDELYVHQSQLGTLSVIDSTIDFAYFSSKIRSFHWSGASKVLDMKDCAIENFRFERLIGSASISISSTTPASVADVIQSFEIDVNNQFSGTLHLANYRIEKIQLSGSLGSGGIALKHVACSTLEFQDFLNDGHLKILNFQPRNERTLLIKDSDLGQARVYVLDLNLFSKIDISNSSVQDIHIASIKWCSRHQAAKVLRAYGQPQLRELFRQIKLVVQRAKDRPEELRFLGLEMDAYRHEIANTPGMYGERWILRFNRWTNDHGQSWTQPLLIILCIVMLFYFPIKVLLGFTEFSWSYAPSAIAEILESLNPVRKFSESFGLMGKVKNNPQVAWARVLDFVFLRLIVGLLIFQMVKAFRKYIS